MLKENKVPYRTITLILGIIVAIFLFISALFLQQKKQGTTQAPDNTSTTITKGMDTLQKGALNVYLLIKKIP